MSRIAPANPAATRNMDMAEKRSIVLIDQIEPLILDIRDQKVILDNDLAALYEVSTKRLNEQVRRNRERFPADFMFQLTRE
jgi:ORF6N domain